MNEQVEKIVLGYLEQCGIEPQALEELSEEEFEELCADARIDAYLLGVLDWKQLH